MSIDELTVEQQSELSTVVSMILVDAFAVESARVAEDPESAWGDGTFLRQLMELLVMLMPLIIEIIRGGGNPKVIAPVFSNLSTQFLRSA